MAENETQQNPINIEEFINGLNDKQKLAFLNNLKKELKANNLKIGSNVKHYYLTDLKQAEKEHIYYFSKLDALTQKELMRDKLEREINQIIKERSLRV
jgi:hypothetical protein